MGGSAGQSGEDIEQEEEGGVASAPLLLHDIKK